MGYRYESGISATTENEAYAIGWGIGFAFFFSFIGIFWTIYYICRTRVGSHGMRVKNYCCFFLYRKKNASLRKVAPRMPLSPTGVRDVTIDFDKLFEDQVDCFCC